MNQPESNLHRAFYALPLPDTLYREITMLIEELRSLNDRNVRWTPAGNLHITLRFLGELTPAQFIKAQGLLEGIVSNRSFRLRITGTDAFPSLGNPSVLILNLEGISPADQAALLALQKNTEDYARQLGLQPEQRPYHPHITLGRVRRGQRIQRLLEQKLRSIESDRFIAAEGTVQTVHLVESTLTPSGARYRTVTGYDLSD